MPKTTKKRTQTKTLTSKKKKLSTKDMKKVKGGQIDGSLTSSKKAPGLLLPAVQKVRE
jgi:hypothetical protein